MKPVTITISRQYGSGGHAVAERLSKELDIPCYDNEAISMAARESGIADWEFSMSGNPQFPDMIFALSNTTPYCEVAEMPYGERIFLAQSDAIRRLADRGSAIFVGRCGSYVLQGRAHCLHLFICGSPEARERRAVEVYGLGPKEAERAVRRVDKARAAYYYTNTGLRWGYGPGYDLTINTDRIGVEGAVGLVKACLEMRK